MKIYFTTTIPALILTALCFLVSCASQRQKAVCTEIEIRLNNMSQSAEQREFLKEELRQCEEQQKEYAGSDSLTNKMKKSIYELYQESAKDSSLATQETSSASVLENSSEEFSENISETHETP